MAGGQTPDARPRLVFFHSSQSGQCRRVEGFLAQVLQRRRNHETFKLLRVDERERPDLFERFRVETIPTILLVESKAVHGRLEQPRSCVEIERFLAPWLRGNGKGEADAETIRAAPADASA